MRTWTRTTTPLVSLIALGLLLVACDQEGPAGLASSDGLLPPGDPVAERVAAPPARLCAVSTYDLIAAQMLVVGSVEVANDEDDLYVTIRAQDGWTLAETHLAITDDPDLIPKAGKRIAPGRFPDRTVHAPAAPEVTYRVPRSVLDGSSVAVVAAHADVVKGERSEGAWVDGTEIRSGGSWASYAAFDLVDCVRTIDGAAGGVLNGDGATLDVSAGSFSGSEAIAIYPIPVSELPGGALPGTAFDFDPDGLQFDPPAELEISYDDTGLSLTEEQALAIHHLTPAGVWEALPSSVVDTAADLITAQVEHFSVYAVVPSLARVTLSVSPQPVAEGGELRHEVTVENLSGAAISGGELRVDVQGAFDTPTSPPGCLELVIDPTSHLLFVCPLDLAAGETAVVEVSVRARAGSGGTRITSRAEYAGNGQVAVTADEGTDILALPEADIALSMAVSPQPVEVGTPLTHAITVENLGPAGSGGFQVVLEVDEDVSVTGFPSECGWTNVPGLKVVVCDIPALPYQGSHPLTLEVEPQTAGQTLESHAYMQARQGFVDPSSANDEATTTTTITTGGSAAAADLSATLTDGPDPVLVGNVLTYTVGVANAGPDPVSAVEMDVRIYHASLLPAAPAFPQGNCAVFGHTADHYLVQCTVAAVAANDTETFQIAIQPTDVGTLTTAAEITGWTGPADPTSADHAATTTTTVEAALVSDLSLTMADSPDPVAAGDPLTYDFSLANAGPDDATDVRVDVTIFHGTDFTTPATLPAECLETSNTPDRYTYRCTFASLPGGATEPFSIGIVPLEQGDLVAEAGISSWTGGNDPDAADRQASDITSVGSSSPYTGQLLFTSDRNGTSDLYLKDLGTGAVTQLTNGEGALAPEWSPDGTRIAYSTRVSGDDYAIRVFTLATSTMATVATGFRANEPTWSPDGSRIAYTSYTQTIGTDQFDWDIHVVDLATLADQIVGNSDFTDREPDWSSDGTRIAFQRERPGSDFELVTVDVATDVQTVIYNGLLHDLQWSADDTRILAYQSKTSDPIYEIVVLDVATGVVSDVTAEGTRAQAPVWSPDGSQVAFSLYDSTNGFDVYVVPISGGSATLVEGTAAAEWAAGWRP